MKRKIYISVLTFIGCLAVCKTYAQHYTATNQDCCDAIQICSKVFTQPQFINAGAGGDVTEFTGNCASTVPCTGTPSYCGCKYENGTCNEQNDIWYAVTIKTAGTLAFTLVPFNPDDDYNFAIYTGNCQDLHGSSVAPISCNFCNLPGSTGLDPRLTSTSITSQHQSAVTSCTSFNPVISATAGTTYYINISWVSVSIGDGYPINKASEGYVLDFTKSTAEFVDNTPPAISSVIASAKNCTVSTGTGTLSVNFSEKVLEASVYNTSTNLPYNPTDFVITSTDPTINFTITSISGNQPAPTLVIIPLMQTYTITYTYTPSTAPLDPHSLTLAYNGHALGYCGNPASPQVLPVTVNYTAVTPVAFTESNVALVGSNLCDVHSFQLCGPSGYSMYYWYKDNVLYQSGNYAADGCITVSDAGSYNLIVTDGSGCATVSFPLEVN